MGITRSLSRGDRTRSYRGILFGFGIQGIDRGHKGTM